MVAGSLVEFMWWSLAVIVWVAIAFWPARVAGRKGHSFFLYFLFSLGLRGKVGRPDRPSRARPIGPPSEKVLVFFARQLQPTAATFRNPNTGPRAETARR